MPCVYLPSSANTGLDACQPAKLYGTTTNSLYKCSEVNSTDRKHETNFKYDASTMICRMSNPIVNRLTITRVLANAISLSPMNVKLQK